MIEVRNNRDDSHIYDYKGRIFFDVEVIGVYDRTASVRDTKTGMTWTVFKKELGLKEKKQAHKYPYHFNRRDCKRKWKGKQDKLINTIKSYSDKGAFERGL